MSNAVDGVFKIVRRRVPRASTIESVERKSCCPSRWSAKVYRWSRGIESVE